MKLIFHGRKKSSLFSLNNSLSEKVGY